MLKEEHERIKEMIKNKIKNMQESSEHDNNEDIQRFRVLYNLFDDKNHQFFSSIDIHVAFSILEDIGIDPKDIPSIYAKIKREETDGKYVLMDMNFDNKEER